MSDFVHTISFDDLVEITKLIRNVYGFDFVGYSQASLKRRVTRIMQLNNLSLFEIRSRLTNDSAFFDQFLTEVTVNVTEMFRDPGFFKVLRNEVFPYLASFQRIKVWNAGCSSGEELYSFAILLEEQGLYSRSFLYGTDINTRVLSKAKKGIYELSRMKQYSENFIATGSAHSLSDFYTAKYEAATISNKLKKNILFSVHNLVSDGVFNEFQMISCRNVLIYFDVELQERVIQLFYDSLCMLGFLCLGSKETLRSNEMAKRFRVVSKTENIYQKIA
ncbi:MAG: chemotaxis protein CheR [Sphingobacteriaceae bacterium]|jgi:chemotaxis protein methyltransferase CheR|nr:chemotaxis protein CheR [Sphingobacteriaceae bacterium]